MSTDSESSARHSTSTRVSHPGTSLLDAVTNWPTPCAADEGQGETPETWEARNAKKKAENENLGGLHERLAVAVQRWTTPSAGTHNVDESPETWEARRQGMIAKGCNGNGAGEPLGIAVQKWNTPLGSIANGTRREDGKRSVGTNSQAENWPTPRAGKHGSPGSDAGHPTIESLWGTPRANTQGAQPEPPEGLWGTPTAHDGRRPGPDTNSTQHANLSREASLWATPLARDYRSDSTEASFQGSPPLGRQVLATPQAGPAGSDPADRPRLCVAFVESLMGYPRGWTSPTVRTDCAPSGTL